MACRLGTHTNNLRRRLYTLSVSTTASLHYRSSSGTVTGRSQPFPIRQLSSSMIHQHPRGLLASVSADLFSEKSNRETSFHAIIACHDKHRQYRWFHSSSLHLAESGEMSEKDKKKALKAKAKAAAAAKATEDEAAAEKNSGAAEEALPPKQDDEPSSTGQVAAEGDASATENCGSESKEAAPASSPPLADNGETSPPREYSTPELTKDAAKHKAGLKDATRPDFQNPLHHNNPDMEKLFPEDFDSPEQFQKAVLPVFPFDEPDGKVTAPGYLHEIADEIVHLTMLEMNELVNKIADHFGFHEGMLSPDGSADEGEDVGDDEDGGGDGEGAAAAAAAEKRTAFDVKLVGFDAKAKIKIIKEVRTIVPGLGLKEAKELVEGAPKVIQKGINMELAEEIKAKLEELGATVEIV